MIRPLTCICMLLAGGSGLYLYQSKHQAQMLDREIARTSKAADAARERIGVLRGEWALLNEPDRLAALSQEHLGLKTLTPAQFVTAGELAARLPPPVMPGAAPEPAGENDAALVAALPAPPPPAPAPAAPARPVIAAKQPLPTPSQPVPAPPRPPVQVASALPMPAAPLPTPKPVPPRPAFAPLVNVSASPTAVPALPAPRPPQARAASPSAAVPSRPTAPDGDSAMRVAQHIPGPGIAAPAAAGYGLLPAVPVSASVLGGARPLLPPPVPYGSAMAVSGASAR